MVAISVNVRQSLPVAGFGGKHLASIHILHLTDLHLASEVEWNHQVLLDALKADLEKLRFTQDAPSLVVFSGDLASDASTPGTYEAVLEYLLAILDTLGLDDTRLIICPGNHDASRDVVGPALPLIRTWRTQAETLGGANDLAADQRFQDYVKGAYGNYNALGESFGQSSLVRSDGLSNTYFFRDLGLSLIAVNTPALTAAGLTPELEDRGHLFIAERTLETAAKGCPAGLPIVVVGHHPPTWLNDQSASVLDRWLSDRAVAYLSGHLHETSPRLTSTFNGTYFHCQSGALYCSRDYWNGYTLLSMEIESLALRTMHRRWFEPRHEFSKAEDLGDDGVFYSSKESKKFWRTVTPNVDLVTLDHWRETVLLPEIVEDCNNSLSTHDLSSVFVEPEFEHDVPYRTETDGRLGSRLEILSFSDLFSSVDNFVISAAAETGKSTILRQLALGVASQRISTATWTIPAFVQFSNIRGHKPNIAALIRQKVPELPFGLTVNSLLSEGHLTLLVDDVDFAAKERRDSLIKFVSTYPKCRFIFTSSTTFVESSALRPEIAPDVPFTRVRMRPFRQAQLLTLIENHGTTDPLKADQMLGRVLRDASALNVPITAVTGTFLIQILQEKQDHTILNQAALIERYIEMLLEKYAPREVLPGTFDFKNKVDLLCAIAEQMVRTGEYAPDENVILQWCISYLKGYGLNFSARSILEYLVQSRILEKIGSTVRFRLRMFFEFFAATRMIDSEEFKNTIFDRENYLAFINEVGFYAAISRRDKEQLERIFQAFERLHKEVWDSRQGVKSADQYLEQYVVPGKGTTEDELKALQRQIRSDQDIAEDRLTLLEGVDYEEDADTQLVSRVEFVTAEERWLGHLVLLSGMVKHTELIPDWDKRRYLAGVLQGWVQFAANSLGIIGDLARDRRVAFNGVTYVSTLADNLPVGEVARRLALSMPTAAARMAATFVGTEKLRLQLEDGLGSSAEPPSRQLMRISVLADMGLEDFSKPAAKAAATLKEYRFLNHVFARKLYEVAVRFRLDKDELNALRALAGEALVAIESPPHGEAARRKSAIIEGINRQRVRMKLLKKRKD